MTVVVIKIFVGILKQKVITIQYFNIVSYLSCTLCSSWPYPDIAHCGHMYNHLIAASDWPCSFLYLDYFHLLTSSGILGLVKLYVPSIISKMRTQTSSH